MIPAEAVEAAAKAWCGTIDLAGWQRRHIMKLLEAATPHIQAYLLAELRKAHEALQRVEGLCSIAAKRGIESGPPLELTTIRAAVAAAKEAE